MSEILICPAAIRVLYFFGKTDIMRKNAKGGGPI